ncbi:unnamed protein product [Gongylonema pulchrum]|uniref:DUF2283 domain-containing protein n=1 Tax=Gongylonema pulchrum TaxID=637853 RepID=A0A183DF23_9BILA|nr:unnamed protein product [Gongylonema pulchrum]
MKSVAKTCEKHVTYQDTYYLTYDVDGSEAVVELVDPGLEHTGAREMSIRKADAAILFYQASSQSSFNQLYDVVHDFHLRRNDFKVIF